MSACGCTPTPTLPRKRERERTVLVSSSSLHRKHEMKHRARFSSLSRVRGRVARSSERDGWGLARQQTLGKG
jgi:hypothetical protein